jgi:hypothetical protein
MRGVVGVSVGIAHLGSEQLRGYVRKNTATRNENAR